MKHYLLICLFFILSSKVYSQCTLTVSITASSPTICSGNSVTLTATPAHGTPPYSYVWSTGETTASISVNKGATYTVTVSDKTSGCQPVQQSITVTTTTAPNPPTANNVIVCPNTQATVTATGPGGNYQWYDAQTGGNFLGSGASYTTPQPVTANTVLYVQTTIDNCTSIRTPVYVSLPSSPIVKDDTICQGNVATLIASGGTSYAWYDASSGGNEVGTDSSYTTPVLTASKTYYVVVVVNGCASARTPVTARVTPAPTTPTASNVTICSGNTAQLHASASSGTFDWYDVPSGGTSLITSPDYTTPVLTATTTYYVQTSLRTCTSPRVPVTVTVNPPPAPPTAQTDSICYGNTATLTAGTDPSSTYEWYNSDPVNGTAPFFKGATYTTPALTSSTTYFVQSVNGSCTSSTVQINVIVKSPLPAPSASGAIICYGSTATLSTKYLGGTYQWYDSNGTLLVQDTSFTTPALTTSATYYVQRTLEGCVSPRTTVKVTVEPADPAPTVSTATICSGNQATLTAKSADNIYAWYDAPSGGNLLSTAPVYTTPALTSTTTYYVQTTSSTGCNSPMTAATVTVNPTPTAPSANNVTVCPGTPATLTATPASPSDAIKWYTANGTSVATGNSYTTPPITDTVTYYAESTNGSCTSSRTPVKVSLVDGTHPEFQYSSGTYCISEGNTTPVINNPAGGTFSATPAGLVFVSTTTGEINVGASTPGTYKISFTNNAPCPGTTSADVSIVTSLKSSLSYNSPFCQYGTDPYPVFGSGSTAGSFSATPAGLVFVNTSTGQIDLTKSKPGTYTITNAISSSTCGSSTNTATVTINPSVSVDAGPDVVAVAGTPVQLNGSVSGGATTGTWSGGTGTFSNKSDLQATYTPGPGETKAVLTLTSANPAAPCGPKSASVTITFRSQPKAPTAAGTTICSGSQAYLSATAPGGYYRWYDAPTDGNLLNDGAAFTTPVLTANTTYYVQTTVNGVTSSRTAVVVTVISPTAAPTISGDTVICQGSSTTLTASGPAGKYIWYDSPTDGNKVSINNTYTITGLTNSNSYYVAPLANNCNSPRTRVNVTVTSMPTINSAATNVICSGTPLNYTITSNVPSATYTWSRAKVSGISNPAVSGQTSTVINDTLINTTINPIKVTYAITPANGNCTGPVFNYVVTVYPTPYVTSADSATICDQTPVNYTIKFNSPSTTFSWSRAAVPGISNAAVSGQSIANIQEVLNNTTNNPVKVTYTFNYQINNCNGIPFNYVVTVNPMATVTSAATGSACSDIPQNYTITSNIPSATYTWSRAAVPYISNPAVSNQTSSTITEKLVNTSSTPKQVVYTIIPSANGCTSPPFTYKVVVSPGIATPVANSNTPVCTGSTITVSTTAVTNATYQWTKPDGTTVTTTKPELDIPNATAADAGTYSLVTIVGGCQSQPDSTSVQVDAPAVANAGPNQRVCKYDPVVHLQGSVTGGTTTGFWKTSGSGTFLPSNTALTGTYVSSAQDVQQDSIVLTLTSTSKDNCPSSSSMVVKYGPLPGVSAGPDTAVCSQVASVAVSGKDFAPGTGVMWSTMGTGNFTNKYALNTSYAPSAADVSAGSVQLVLQITGNNQCYTQTDTMTIHFVPPAKVNAGGIRYVLKGYTITLTPTVSEDSVKYLWSPNVDMNNDTLKNPTITGDVNRTYTLTVTDKRGCVSSDTVYVDVSPTIKIDNAFTPNGDGINDTWNITGLIAYVNATVDIFTRYGQPIFHSIGYPVPWDGTYNGKPLPVGVYYYVIHLNVNNQVLSGPVTLLR